MRLFKLIENAKRVQADNIDRLSTIAHDYLLDTHPELFSLVANDLDPHVEPDKNGCYWGPKGVVTWEIMRNRTVAEQAIVRIRAHVDTHRSYADLSTPYSTDSWQPMYGNDFTAENIGRALAIAADLLDERAAKKSETAN